MELTDLPTELLREIISHISLNSHLASVVLVSRLFKPLAEPFLYRDIHLNAEPLEEFKVGFRCILRWTYQLIANLRARPELGRYTTTFSLRVPHPLWYQNHPYRSIINRMPGLRQLSSDPPCFNGDGLSTNANSITALRFDFSHVPSHWDDYGGSRWLQRCVPLKIISTHLWHPSVRKLQAEKLLFMDNFVHKYWLGARREELGPSRVEDLRFLDCCPRINGDAVRAFINAIRRLRCFVLEIKSPWEPVTVPPHTPAQEMDIRSALLAHQAWIQELAVSTTGHALQYHTLIQSPGSFVEFTALRRLAMPFAMLSHIYPRLHDVLPPQLEELQLQESIYHFSPPGVQPDHQLFKAFAEKKEAYVPGLKNLIWWIQPSATKERRNSHAASILEQYTTVILGEVGVKFKLISTSFFKDTPFGQRLYEW